MSDGVDAALVIKYKTQLLEHLRKRPRDNLALGDLRDEKNKTLAVAAMQLVREYDPKLILSDFGTSMTLSMRISIDRLSQDTLTAMKQEQLLFDAAALDGLDYELPAAPGVPQVAPQPEGSVK